MRRLQPSDFGLHRGMNAGRSTPQNPETSLAIAYAPARVRPALETLFALDDRLARIVAAAREPALGELRLVWWRDALAGLDVREPPAEPLLRQVTADILPLGIAGADLGMIADGWADTLDREAMDDAVISRHAAARGGTLFAVAARLLGEGAPDVVRAAGETWAIADVALRTGIRVARAAGARERWPAHLRPLGMLAALARRDLARLAPERRGSPARVARMVAHRLTGR
jgi:phytoene synthase